MSYPPIFVQVFILKDFRHTSRDARSTQAVSRAMKPSEKPQVSARTKREPRTELQKPIARLLLTDRHRKLFGVSTGPCPRPVFNVKTKREISKLQRKQQISTR